MNNLSFMATNNYTPRSRMQWGEHFHVDLVWFSATKRLYGAVVLSFRITTGFIQVRIEEPTPLIETLFQVIIFYFVMK